MRSQGFKTFISFIVTISAEVETGNLENYVLILDEPETHLHPSGVKYMRDELLKLSSNNNHVFFATHSIFMIDRSNLRRHIITSKEDERTLLTVVNRNNILQEDVIYQALGTSIDEFSISNYNFLFEGELDVKLFSFFLEHCISKKDNKIKDFELLDGGGTTKILKYFTDKSLPKHSKWYFILDKDAAGRELPGKIEKVTIEEVYRNCHFAFYAEENDYELEDILPRDIVKAAFDSAIEGVNCEYMIDFSQDKVISKLTEEFYGKNKISKNDKQEMEKKFKTQLDSLTDDALQAVKKEANIPAKLQKFKEILPKYFDFLRLTLSKHDMNLNG